MKPECYGQLLDWVSFEREVNIWAHSESIVTVAFALRGHQIWLLRAVLIIYITERKARDLCYTLSLVCVENGVGAAKRCNKRSSSLLLKCKATLWLWESATGENIRYIKTHNTRRAEEDLKSYLGLFSSRQGTKREENFHKDCSQNSGSVQRLSGCKQDNRWADKQTAKN